MKRKNKQHNHKPQILSAQKTTKITAEQSMPLQVQLANQKFWKDPKAIIELAVAILTLLSVILVGWSVYEMKLQRESAYKPVLAVGDTSFSFSGWVYGNYEDGSKYLMASSITDIISGLPLLRFKIENIGLGIAKNIKCEWSEDNYSRFSTYLKTNNEIGKNLVLDEDGDLKIAKYNDEILFMTNISPAIELPFIKIGDSDNNYIEVDATVYGYLCTLCSIGYFSAETQPELVLNISYEDIYSKKYYAQVHIRYIISRLRIDDEFQYYISFKTSTIYSE